MIVRCTPIVTGLVLSSIVLAAVSARAQAASISQRSLVMNTCMTKFRPPISSHSQLSGRCLWRRSMLSRWLIANWLSGYYHAKRNNWIVDSESFENNVNKLNNYCYDEKNFKVPIMEAVERVLGK
jgi:hypothetical protein